MIEALCCSAIALFLIVYLCVRKPKKDRGWEQMGFPDFMRKEKARRTEKG